MAKQTPGQVFQTLLGAGFTADQATTLDAIAGGESGWDDTELGDVNLQDNTWGPSVGLFQIRTLKADTGRGSDRDINWLMASDANQAKAAWDISQHGRDWSPWTVWTSGKWRGFLSAVQSSPGTGGSTTTAGGAVTVTPAGWGPSWLPWNWASSAASEALGGARSIAMEAVFVGLGLALLGGGLAVALSPRVAKRVDQAAQVAKVAAVAA